MRAITRGICAGVALGVMTMLAGCSAEVGSEKWCSDLQEKSKADWTANEVADFAKHCVLQ